jgi:glycosyltransferase involved in cell wall biosynthesis
VADGLRALGWQIQVVVLDASFPRPSTAARADAAAKLAAIDDDERVLIDGLALGALPELAERHRTRLRLLGLVHHPLAHETGLSVEQQARLRASEPRALASTRRVVTTSVATRDRLTAVEIEAERVAVIEPGTDPAPLARRAGQEPLQLLCVGALIPRKGHRTLIEALGAVSDLRWTLELIGDTERDPATANAVRSQIRDLGLEARVRVRGQVDEAALEAAYLRADLFVLPSLFEGYGMAFAEALARGLPILGSGDGAVRETVPSAAGLLVEPGSSAALATGLRRVLTDAKVRAELAAGAEHARERLPDWPTQAQRWARLLEHV